MNLLFVFLQAGGGGDYSFRFSVGGRRGCTTGNTEKYAVICNI